MSSIAKSQHKLYRTWINMKARCCHETSPWYQYYGARGITICDKWNNDFWAFVSDVGTRPSPKHTLDRVDNSGPYCKSNCRWATRKEQSKNTRSNIYIKHNGRQMSIDDLAKESGIQPKLLRTRIRERGWSVVRAINTPVSSPRINIRWLVVGGEKMSVAQAAVKYNIPYKTIHSRLNLGWTGSDAVKPARKSWLCVNGNNIRLRDAAATYGVDHEAIRGRLKRGWTGEEAVGLVPRERHSKRQ